MNWMINSPFSTTSPAGASSPLLGDVLFSNANPNADLAVAGKPQPKTNTTPVRPQRPSDMPNIDRGLPTTPSYEKEGKAVLSAVNALASKAAGADPKTFNYKKYANDLNAAEKKFDSLLVSDPLKQQFAKSLAKARSYIRVTKAEVPPPELPIAPGGSPKDGTPGNVKRGVQAQADATNKALNRGQRTDPKPYLFGSGALDGNANFERIVGAGSGATLPVYTLTNFPSSVVIAIDLKKVSLVPAATRTASNYSPKGVVQPNPLYANEPIGRFADRAITGGVKDIDQNKFLGAFNAAFFNDYGPETTISLPSLVNGKVTSTGKIEEGNKVALVWDNKAGTASVQPWTANDPTAPSYPQSNGAKPLASPNEVAKGFGKSVGNANANGFVGYNPLTLPEGKTDVRNSGTFVGVNAKGKIAVLVSAGNMTPRQAHQALSSAGYTNVIALDSGPSSQVSMVTNRRNDKGVATRDTESMIGSITNRGVPIPITIQLK